MHACYATHAVYALYLSLNLAEYALDFPMAYVLVMPYLVCFDRYSGTTSPGASVGPPCIESVPSSASADGLLFQEDLI